MEKKNTLLLTVIAVATLLVAVVGATFAYFASSVDNGTGTQFTANTAPMSSAFVATGYAFTLDVTADKMQSVDADEGKIAAESTDGKIEITYGSSVDDTAMYCKYDVYFDWTGTAYTAHSPIAEGSEVLYASGEDVVGYEDPREFTIQATFASEPAVPEDAALDENGKPVSNYLVSNEIATEIDFTQLTTGTEPVKVGEAYIWSNKAGVDNKTVHTWTFKSVFYNIPAYQNALAGQTFTGVFTVENVVC